VKARCHVTFTPSGKPGGPAAILWDQHGRALNAMNYPRGHKFTAKERARSRQRLMPGCQELASDLDRKYGAGGRGELRGARRRRRRK
jgi:hypothetical protein